MPAIHWVIALQSSRLRGSESRPDMTVAPVAVKPETDSNRASAQPIRGLAEDVGKRAAEDAAHPAQPHQGVGVPLAEGGLAVPAQPHQDQGQREGAAQGDPEGLDRIETALPGPVESQGRNEADPQPPQGQE